MNAATNKATATTIPARKGPSLWGVKLVRVIGRGAGILTNVDCDWRTNVAHCSVEMADGEMVYVTSDKLEVIG